jgi:ATP:corrinoid adenosyltransferase
MDAKVVKDARAFLIKCTKLLPDEKLSAKIIDELEVIVDKDYLDDDACEARKLIRKSRLAVVR